MIIEFFLIMMLIAGCIIASYTDLKYGKIENKLIVVLMIVATLGNAILYGFLKRELLVVFILNIIVIILASILLYATHIWAGGDCKLLIMGSALIPAEFYWHFENSEMTLWITLVFMFCAGFIYLILETVVFILKEKPQFDYKTYGRRLFIRIKNYIRMIVYMSAFHHIYYYFGQSALNIPDSIYICVCVLVSWMVGMCEIAKSRILVVAVLLFDAGMTVFTGNVMVSLRWQTYILVIVFMFLKMLLEKYNYQEIEVKNLKPGMILSKGTSMWMQQSRVKGLPGISDETLKSRLQKDEVESIWRWSKSKYGMETVLIVRKIPFAIFISIGFIFYLICGVYK